jgi:hypothetical protein
MTTQLKRMRIAPTWRAGLRRGRERNSTMLLLQRYPEFEARLNRAVEDLRRWGVVPAWEHVKKPFDYV